MQTKNMRFLKASVLCLSIALLTQTGHAAGGYLDDLENDRSNEVHYTGGVPLMLEQKIEGWSKRIAKLQLDWLLPLDPKQAKDHTLVKQRAAHRNELVAALPFAFTNLSNSHGVEHVRGFQNTLGAIASGKPASVKDVADRDVRNALKDLAENAPDVDHRLATLVLRKVAFECSKVAKMIKEAPDAKQAGFMQYALQELQSTNVLQDLAVQPFANEFQALFQQASASASKRTSRRPQSRTLSSAHRHHASRSVGGSASLAAQGLPSTSVSAPFGFGQAPRQSQTVPAFPPASGFAGGVASQAAPGLPRTSVGAPFSFGQAPQQSQSAVRPQASSASGFAGGVASQAAQNAPSAWGTPFSFDPAQQQAPSVKPRVGPQVAPQYSSSSSDEEEIHGAESYRLNDEGQPVRYNPQVQKSSWGFSHRNTADAGRSAGFEDFQNFESDDDNALFVPATSRQPAPVLSFEDPGLEDRGAAALPHSRLDRTPSVVNRNNVVGQNYKRACDDLQELAGATVSADVIDQACKAAQMILATLPPAKKADAEELLSSMQDGLQKGEYEEGIEAAVNQFGGVKDLMEALGFDVPESSDRTRSSSSSDSESDSSSNETVVGQSTRKSGRKSN